LTPPIWLDEHGKEVPTRKCCQSSCTREYPLRRYRYATLKQIGWPLYRVASFTNWCGHGQEVIPVPIDREWVQLVPIIGEAK
jgi:hypothetical protein